MRIAIIGAALLALAACEVPTPEPSNQAVAKDNVQFNVVDAPAPIARARPVTALDGGRFPADFRGRWGLVPADCTSTRGDAKGLMIVEADRLTFYESRASVAKLTAVSPNEVRAALEFTGEGQTWRQETPLILEDNATALTRIADGQTLRYARCKS